MSNSLLLCSSLVCACIHAVFFAAVDCCRDFEAIVAFGLLTSILNHASTNAFLKWLDRLVVFVCALHDMYLCYVYRMALAYHGVVVCGFLYLVGYHLESHFLLTFTHVQMLLQIYQQELQTNTG